MNGRQSPDRGESDFQSRVVVGDIDGPDRKTASGRAGELLDRSDQHLHRSKLRRSTITLARASIACELHWGISANFNGGENPFLLTCAKHIFRYKQDRPPIGT
jgi:hypothetical protein